MKKFENINKRWSRDDVGIPAYDILMELNNSNMSIIFKEEKILKEDLLRLINS
jgi:hypothetical protein